MPSEQEIENKIRDLKAFAEMPTGKLLSVIQKVDAEDTVVSEEERTTGFLPSLPSQQMSGLKAFLLDPAPSLSLDAALRAVAAAVKANDQPKFWRAALVLLKAVKSNMPHLEDQFQ